MVLSLRMRLRSGRWSGCHVKTCLSSLSGRSHDNLESWIGIFINDRLFLRIDESATTGVGMATPNSYKHQDMLQLEL